MHIVDLIVVCAAVLVLLACALVLARQRFMLRAPGAIPVALLPGVGEPLAVRRRPLRRQ